MSRRKKKPSAPLSAFTYLDTELEVQDGDRIIFTHGKDLVMGTVRDSSPGGTPWWHLMDRTFLGVWVHPTAEHNLAIEAEVDAPIAPLWQGTA